MAGPGHRPIEKSFPRKSRSSTGPVCLPAIIAALSTCRNGERVFDLIFGTGEAGKPVMTRRKPGQPREERRPGFRQGPADGQRHAQHFRVRGRVESPKRGRYGDRFAGDRASRGQELRFLAPVSLSGVSLPGVSLLELSLSRPDAFQAPRRMTGPELVFPRHSTPLAHAPCARDAPWLYPATALPSSSGPGRRPLTAETGVRFP